LADIEDIGWTQAMPQLQRTKLFLELCVSLGWDTQAGVYDEKDAVIYLFS
jgi:hypothetical protein